MDRETIYDVINLERDYQDEKWADPKHKSHEIECWILYMEYYLNKAKESITLSTVEESTALDNLRKVVALGVACFEYHGVPHRKK